MRTIIACILLGIVPAVSQTIVGDKPSEELRYLVDLPTAGMLRSGAVAVDIQAAGSGALLSRVSIGISNRISFGLSYGGTQLLGAGTPNWYGLPGLAISGRLMNETATIPALVLGIDTQGRRKYESSTKSYDWKSLGVYVVTSRNYRFLGSGSLHLGVNYSFEQRDGKGGPNVFGGAEKSIGPYASIVVEYNAGVSTEQGLTKGGKGFLNAGVWINIGGGVAMAVSARDIFGSTTQQNERILEFQSIL